MVYPLYQKVFYITPDDPVEVQGVKGPPGQVGIGSDLFVPPQTFLYNEGWRYELRQEGLVGFLAITVDPSTGQYRSDGGYRIVTKADGKMSLLPFMRAMAALCQYGNRDEGLATDVLKGRTKYRKIAMRCGYVTTFVRDCASQVGIETRTVSTSTLLTPWNGVDDGHIFLEAKDDHGRWKVFDVPNDIYFIDDYASLASLADVALKGPNNLNMVKLARSDSYAQSYPDASLNQVPLDILHEYLFATDAKLRQWLTRMHEAPSVSIAGKVYFGLLPGRESFKAQLENASPGVNVALPWADWMKLCYG